MISARDYDEQNIKLAIQTFRKHQLITSGHGRWLLARRNEDESLQSTYLTEVISLYGGRLFVGGDIDDCTFAYYSSARSAAEALLDTGKLCWIGHCQDVSYYVAQKARIGLCDNGLITSEWDNAVALHELRELMKDIPEGATERAMLGYAQAACERNEGEESVLGHIHDALDEIPDLFGRVTSLRVIYAWAACRRLCQILFGQAEDDRYATYDMEEKKP